MEKVNLIQLVCAIFTIISLIGIGISIAVPSFLLLGISLSITFFCCGLGFSLKRVRNFP